MKVILTIAGSDSGGGAGIQADLKTISANGGFGLSVITAVTAQNTRAVTTAFPIPANVIEAQIEAVFDDFDIGGVKTGMLANRAIIGCVALGIERHEPQNVVVDPVMVSKTGYPLLDGDAVGALKERLLPLATVVTPNVHEAELLSGIKICSAEDAESAARRILDSGPRAVVVKGGHLRGQPALDVLATSDEVTRIPGEFIQSSNTHGTGCTYASAIATHLARGLPLREAVERSKAYVAEAIRAGPSVGGGVGPTDHFFFLRNDKGQQWLQHLRLRDSAAE